VFKKGDITVCLHRDGGYQVAVRLPCDSTAAQISNAILQYRAEARPQPQYHYVIMNGSCGPMGCPTCGGRGFGRFLR
jgi:hypothetical protein